MSRRWHTLQPLPGNINIDGYVTYNIRGDDGCKNNQYAHRLLAMTFLGKPPSKKHYASHRNGDPSDNRLSNIYWATPKENSADTKRHGRHSNGASTKLNREQVEKIKQLFSLGGRTLRSLGEEFNVSHSTVHRLLHLQSWR